MDISHYEYIYPALHDMSAVRSNEFHKVDYTATKLFNTANSKLLSPDFYGVFHDDRGNLFLGLTRIIRSYSLILTYQETDYHINCTYYDEVKHLLDWAPSSTQGIFQFVGSEPMANYDPARCDTGRRNVPSTFLRPGQVAAGVGNCLKPVSQSDIESIFVLLSVDSVGHLLYCKYYAGQHDDNENFVLNEGDLPAASRSIFPLLKLMLEWASMTDEPWNSTENVAVASKQFFEKLGMPDAVKNSIESQGPMHIYRYLRGDDNARQQPHSSEISPIDDLTKSWLKTKMLYPNVMMFYRALTN